MRPISLSSSTLNPAQQNYSTGEKETWAIVAATRRWRKYLQAAKQLVIWSDHNPLEWMRKQRDPKASLQDGSWNSNYLIQYRRGSDNLAADRLSRSAPEYDHFVNDEDEFFERYVYCALETNSATGVNRSEFSSLTESIQREQARDPVIATL